jgi:nitroimidazol reductase NimA-like FMN-containing flavoprotein (pyridoxamine 5'-phosphate oxidase superfamily)
VTVGFARDNEPYVVTLSYGYEPSAEGTAEGGRLYLHAAHIGQKHDFMSANPSVCATIVLDLGYKDGECAHEYESAVLRGTLSEVDDHEERLHGMDVLIGHLEGAGGVEPMFARHELAGEAVYHRLAVLRLDVETVSAKRGS